MIIAIIPAKKNSNRFPNKNMYKINNKTLIDYSIEYIKKSNLIDEYYISTDSNYIKKYYEALNYKVILRPENLSGETPLVDVYKYSLKQLNKNYHIVSGVQPDHPDRKVSLDKSLNYFIKNDLDCLYSKDKKNNKNGAHHIMNFNSLMINDFKKIDYIYDDCTNVHVIDDIQKVEINLNNKN